MYVHICIFMYMYIACTYMFMLVRNLVNMYIHVCTMYRDVCSDLPILVQVVRIPDGRSAEPPLVHLWQTRIPGTVRPGPAGSSSTTSCYGTYHSQISMYLVRTEYRKHDKSTYFRLKVRTFCVTYQYVLVRTEYILICSFSYRLFYISKGYIPGTC